jgi:hypothetical protein
MSDRIFDVRESMRQFSLGELSPRTEEDVLSALGMEPNDDLEETIVETLPLASALDALQVRNSPTWVDLSRQAQELIEDFERKSKNAQDQSRLAYLDRAEGARAVLAIFGEAFLNAENRAASTSTDERLLMGDNAKTMLGQLAEPPQPELHDNRDSLIEAASFSPASREEVIANTKRVQDFLKK